MRSRCCFVLALLFGWAHSISADVLYSIKDIGSLTQATGINDAGQVTGGRGEDAFLYSNGHFTDLGSNGEGSGINATGQVTGTFVADDASSYAFLYSNGHLTDLNSLIEPGLGITLDDAPDINDEGQIVAHANNGHAYILTPLTVTPVPEPSSFALSGLALLGLALWLQGTVRFTG